MIIKIDIMDIPSFPATKDMAEYPETRQHWHSPPLWLFEVDRSTCNSPGRSPPTFAKLQQYDIPKFTIHAIHVWY